MDSAGIVALIAAIGAILATASTAWFAQRSSNKHNEFSERQAAFEREEKARISEIEARASYVGLMQRRVSELEGRIDSLVVALGENRAEMSKQERRWRHFVNALIMYASVVRLKAVDAGIEVPRFTGYTRFEEEGGILHESWYGHLGLEEEK